MFSLTLSGGKPPGPPYVSLSLSVSKNSRLSTQPQSFDLPESQLNSKQPSLSDLGKVETRESRRSGVLRLSYAKFFYKIDSEKTMAATLMPNAK